ncbi:MAG: hypothetical protein F6J87_30195 [Spirulina sp. SIO3F2]|nr:hypothetical protein [Spirulina sp. SIO3F2]
MTAKTQTTPNYAARAKQLSKRELLFEIPHVRQMANALSTALARAPLPLDEEGQLIQQEMQQHWAWLQALQKECRRRRISIPVKN